MSQASFRDIKTEVLRRIETRIWPPGHLLPSETELGLEFGCARATINRALRELAESGLLDRRRKAGTTVSRTPVRKATLDIPITRLEVENRGATHRAQVLLHELCLPPAHLAARLGLPQSMQLLHLKTLHLADDRPFLFEDRWVNQKAVPSILTAPLETISANEWLVENALISSGDITFMAENAGVEDANVLGIDIGTALFVIDRLTRIGTMPVTQVRLAYAPGHRMTTHM